MKPGSYFRQPKPWSLVLLCANCILVSSLNYKDQNKVPRELIAFIDCLEHNLGDDRLLLTHSTILVDLLLKRKPYKSWYHGNLMKETEDTVYGVLDRWRSWGWKTGKEEEFIPSDDDYEVE